jgi:hypothetical protein
MGKNKLKPQHQIVVNEVAKGKTQTEAYQIAYPDASYGTAKVNASKLLTKANLSEAVQKRINRALSHNNVTPEEVIGSAAFNMRSSMNDLIDEEGYFDLQKARETGAIDLVKEMEIIESIDLETNKKSVRHKVKYESPASARKEIAGYIGLEKAPQQPINLFTDEEIARELINRMVSKGFERKEVIEAVKGKFPGLELEGESDA